MSYADVQVKDVVVSTSYTRRKEVAQRGCIFVWFRLKRNGLTHTTSMQVRRSTVTADEFDAYVENYKKDFYNKIIKQYV